MITCNLRNILAEKKMNRVELAKAAGLSYQGLANLYNDDWDGVKRDTINSICRALNINPEDLFEYEKDMFVCKECSATELYLTIEYIINYSNEDTLSCSCDDASEEIAAQTWWTESIQYQDRGFVYNDHEFEIDEKEIELEKQETEEQDSVVNCHKCFNNSSEQDWEIETESYYEEDSETTYVFCAGCDREIEFGWSNPKRRKKIYPIESDDFNPNKCLVEERYRDKWIKRGWLSKNTES